MIKIIETKNVLTSIFCFGFACHILIYRIKFDVFSHVVISKAIKYQIKFKCDKLRWISQIT